MAVPESTTMLEAVGGEACLLWISTVGLVALLLGWSSTVAVHQGRNCRPHFTHFQPSCLP